MAKLRASYVFMDLEQTCWDPEDPDGHNDQREIIEIGLIEYTSDANEKRKLSLFVKPTINPMLSEYAKKLTSIRQHEIDNAPSLNLAIRFAQAWLGTKPIRFICWGDDVSMLLKEMESKVIPNQMQISEITDLKQLMEAKLKRSLHLTDAVALAGKKFKGYRHRAIYDAQNTIEVFKYYQSLEQ